MQRTQIYLHPEQHRALVREASKKGISLARLIREIIAKHLKEQTTPVSASKETAGERADGLYQVETLDYFLNWMRELDARLGTANIAAVGK